MTQWTSGFVEQWREDLSKSIETHAENIGAVYATGLSKFDKSANDWQEKNAETIKSLSSTLEKSFENWRDERQNLGTQIDRLLEDWQNQLGQSATKAGANISEVRTELDKLESAIASLATTQTAAAKDLKNALDDLKTFSQNVSKETLLGSAISNLQTTISDLGQRLNSNGKDGPSTVSVLFPGSESIESILRELQALSAKISTNIPASRPYSPPPLPPPKPPQPAPNIVITEDPAPPKRSLWKKFKGLFRRKQK
jgi:chromosome segregation ATPase